MNKKIKSHTRCAKRATDALELLKEAHEAGLSLDEFQEYYGIPKEEWHKIQSFFRRHNIDYSVLKGMHKEARTRASRVQPRASVETREIRTPLGAKINFTIEVGGHQ